MRTIPWANEPEILDVDDPSSGINPVEARRGTPARSVVLEIKEVNVDVLLVSQTVVNLFLVGVLIACANKEKMTYIHPDHSVRHPW